MFRMVNKKRWEHFLSLLQNFCFPLRKLSLAKLFSLYAELLLWKYNKLGGKTMFLLAYAKFLAEHNTFARERKVPWNAIFLRKNATVFLPERKFHIGTSKLMSHKQTQSFSGKSNPFARERKCFASKCKVNFTWEHNTFSRTSTKFFSGLQYLYECEHNVSYQKAKFLMGTQYFCKNELKFS